MGWVSAHYFKDKKNPAGDAGLKKSLSREK